LWTLIHHAQDDFGCFGAALAERAHAVSMILASQLAALVPSARGPPAALPRRRTAPDGAVDLPMIIAATDVEHRVAKTTPLLTKAVVHRPRRRERR
jgi:hypothetical protein